MDAVAVELDRGRKAAESEVCESAFPVVDAAHGIEEVCHDKWAGRKRNVCKPGIRVPEGDRGASVGENGIEIRGTRQFRRYGDEL